MVSIIIPVHDASEYTRMCLASIAEHTADYEVVIVDNGSAEDLRPELEGRFQWQYIRNEENRGFPAAMNQGVEAAFGEEICILNNDVLVTRGWLKRLLYHRQKYALVGPCTNFAAGLQRIRVPFYEGAAELGERAREVAMAQGRKARPVRWLIGFCMVMERALFQDLGGFDERFGLGNSEDIDFCLRAGEQGHNMAIARDVFVHHFGGVTHKLLRLDYKGLLRENNEKLKTRWGEDYDYGQEIAAG